MFLRLLFSGTCVLNRMAEGRSELVSFHRFINNQKVTHQKIIGAHARFMAKNIKDRDLICIQDTSDYNYNHHRLAINSGELGTISDGKSLGFRVHPMLVLDAQDHFCYGLSSLAIINTAGQQTNRRQRKYDMQPIEEKQSYRWIEAIDRSKEQLEEARSLTVVADREADIYQLYGRVSDEKTDFVIRGGFGRNFYDLEGNETLIASEQTKLGEYVLKLPTKSSPKREGNQAIMALYAQQVVIGKPQKVKRLEENNDPDKVVLNAVLVREVSVPEGKKPIEWLLLTTKQADTFEQALEVVNIYRARWNIEELFRLTKRKGFGAHESQLETAKGLGNIIAMVFIASVRVLQLLKGRENTERQAEEVFEPEEIELIERLVPAMEGNSKGKKAKNKYPKGTLAYCAWLIARLGSWKPEDRSPPGPISFKRGLDKFEAYINVNNLLSP